MIKIDIYLNFPGTAEEAFNFYKSVFGGIFSMLQRFKDTPESDKLSDSDKNKIMHISIPIGNITLMGSDALESMSHTLKVGDNYKVSISPDSEEETYRIFKELSVGGKIEIPITKMFWGALYGSFTDKFGIQWMINYQL